MSGVRMKNRVVIGQKWRANRDRTTWRVLQVWRNDGLAWLESIDAVAYERQKVTMRQLRLHFTEVES